jgi:hypothetical protein
MNAQTEAWSKEVLHQLRNDEAYARQFIEKMVAAGEDPTEVLERVLGVKVAKEHKEQRQKAKMS